MKFRIVCFGLVLFLLQISVLFGQENDRFAKGFADFEQFVQQQLDQQNIVGLAMLPRTATSSGQVPMVMPTWKISCRPKWNRDTAWHP